jgi:hypothetical protein
MFCASRRVDHRFLIILCVCVVSFDGAILWADSPLGKGGEYGGSSSDDESANDYGGAKKITEEEGRQKDLGKWMKDIEILKQNKDNPKKKSAESKESPRSPGYLNTPKALSSQPELLQGQTETQAIIDEELGFQKQVLKEIDQELQTARGIAKAGNSIVHRGDGATLMYYHGLLMGARNQHYRNGLGLDSIVSTRDIRYDFSRRLMTAFRKDAVDPRGNHTIDERSNIAYTPNSSGLPGRIQRVSGYRERQTDVDGNVTIITRTNGRYNDTANPSYNNMDYASNMITDYDEISQIEGDDAHVTHTQLREARYDTFGNPLTYAKTVTLANGEINYTRRLNSIYQKNPNYVNERLIRYPQIDFSRPEYFSTGYDQYVIDYGVLSDGQILLGSIPQIQHYTNITYDNEDRETGYFRVATVPDNQMIISVTGYSVGSFDQWGNPLTWQTVNTDSYGILSVTDEQATIYDRKNHQIKTVQHMRNENGTDTSTIQTMTYDDHGHLLLTQIETNFFEYNGGPGQIAFDNELVLEVGPAYPHGQVLPPFAGGF